MKFLFVFVLGFVAACNARSISTDLEEWVPAVSVQGTLDDKKITKGVIAIAEKGVVVTTKIHTNGIVEAEGKWKPFTIGGDTTGEYYAKANLNPLTLEAKFNKAGKLDYTGTLDAGEAKIKLIGDKNALRKYDVKVHSGNYNGAVGFGVNGNVDGSNINYEANVVGHQRWEDSNYRYLDGTVTVDFKGNENLKGVNGTLWIGPIGAQIDYDTQGRLLYTAHLNVLDIFRAHVRVDSHTRALDYHAEVTYGIKDVTLTVKANADNSGLLNSHAQLNGYGLLVHAQQNRNGKISGGVRFLQSGFGVRIDGNNNMQFEAGVVANDRFDDIPLDP